MLTVNVQNAMRENFLNTGFTFNPSKITKLHDNCPSCNLKYMIEPSFFYGAMYVNYAITVALSIIIFIVAKLGFQLTLLQTFATIILGLIVTSTFKLKTF